MLIQQHCKHVEKHELVCYNCSHPFREKLKPQNDQFNKFINNISHIHISDTAPVELVEMYLNSAIS